jgi:hypothetical protein
LLAEDVVLDLLELVDVVLVEELLLLEVLDDEVVLTLVEEEDVVFVDEVLVLDDALLVLEVAVH